MKQTAPLRAETVVDRPIAEVRHALSRIDVWQRAATAVGYRLKTLEPGTLWRDGEQVRVDRRDRKLRPISRHRAVVTLDEAGLPSVQVVRGPGSGGRVVVDVQESGTGVTVTVTFDAAGRVRTRFRKRIGAALRILVGMVTLEQHQTRVVVAGALLRDGAVLAARRTYPAELAGRWELPGGKVGPGESDPDALTRELHEELGVDVTVGDRIGPDISLDVELVLRLYAVRAEGEPQSSTEHDELRWLRAADLEDLDWLDADRQLLPELALVLRDASER